MFRAKVKSALVKAKKTGVRPEVHAEPAVEAVSTTEYTKVKAEAALSESIQASPSDDQQVIIDEVVKKALAGDMDSINNIPDRILRAKAKSAYFKAKRQQG